LPFLQEEKTGQATTDSYASLLTSKLTELHEVSVVVSNSHGSNAIKYKVMASNDPDGAAASFAEDKAEATLAAGAAERHVLTGPFVWVSVLIKASIGGSQGTGNAWLYATR